MSCSITMNWHQKSMEYKYDVSSLSGGRTQFVACNYILSAARGEKSLQAFLVNLRAVERLVQYSQL